MISIETPETAITAAAAAQTSFISPWATKRKTIAETPSLCFLKLLIQIKDQ